MKKFLSLLIVSAFALLTVAPALATEASVVSSTKAKEAKFVSRAVTLTGELVQLNSTSAPTQMVVKVTSVWPKKMKKWHPVYPAEKKNVTVNITTTTNLLRSYGAKLAWSEMSVGDKLRIVGKINEDGTVTAKVVKDNSVHVLLLNKGAVESINTSAQTFTIKQKDRILTVRVDANTKWTMAGRTSTTFADLVVGDKVYVGGVINTNSKVVDANRVIILKRPVVKPTATTTAS